MKKLFTSLLLLASVIVRAQNDTVSARHSAYERNSIIATASMGFADGYRLKYSLPSGFVKGNTSGFAPLFLKLEYGLYKQISLAATFGYDAFYCNYEQDYTGNNGPFNRYRTNNTRILSGGLTAFYHLNKIIKVRHLDPFVGIGLSLSNIRYGSLPVDNSTMTSYNHVITLYLKAGARYYITSHFALFADAGLDKQSAFSIGASCRFFDKKNRFGGK